MITIERSFIPKSYELSKIIVTQNSNDLRNIEFDIKFTISVDAIIITCEKCSFKNLIQLC